MVVRSKSTLKSKKTASKKTIIKTSNKKTKTTTKTVKKKPLKKKTVSGNKSVVRKTVGKKPSQSTGVDLAAKYAIEPGPPSGAVPPVEEPAFHEEAIGVVTHYYTHLGVALVQINKGELRAKDLIRIKGHSTDFTQTIGSMEYEHKPVEQASVGQCVGIKVEGPVRQHDILYVTK